jgi:hypothetical protein
MDHKDAPKGKMGLVYMLQGGSDASNDDPFATQPPAGAKMGNHRTACHGRGHVRHASESTAVGGGHIETLHHMGRYFLRAHRDACEMTSGSYRG